MRYSHKVFARRVLHSEYASVSFSISYGTVSKPNVFAILCDVRLSIYSTEFNDSSVACFKGSSLTKALRSMN